MLTNLSTPTSTMSSTFPLNIRANVRLSGRFLLLCPMTNIEASFLFAQNSKDETSSNGRTVFFLEKEMASGLFSAICMKFFSHSYKSPDLYTHQLFHCTIEHLSSMCSLHEDSCTRILNLFWFAGFKGPLRPRIARFPENRISRGDTEEYLHLHNFQHIFL